MIALNHGPGGWLRVRPWADEGLVRPRLRWCSAGVWPVSMSQYCPQVNKRCIRPLLHASELHWCEEGLRNIKDKINCFCLTARPGPSHTADGFVTRLSLDRSVVCSAACCRPLSVSDPGVSAQHGCVPAAPLSPVTQSLCLRLQNWAGLWLRRPGAQLRLRGARVRVRGVRGDRRGGPRHHTHPHWHPGHHWPGPAVPQLCNAHRYPPQALRARGWCPW